MCIIHTKTKYSTQTVFTNGLSFLVIHMTPQGQWAPDETMNHMKNVLWLTELTSYHHS